MEIQEDERRSESKPFFDNNVNVRKETLQTSRKDEKNENLLNEIA
jgi:hypothetical protein